MENDDANPSKPLEPSLEKNEGEKTSETAPPQREEKVGPQPQVQSEDPPPKKKTSTVFKATRKNLQLPRRLFHITNGSLIATLYLHYVEHSFAVHTIGIGVCLFYIFEPLLFIYLAGNLIWSVNLI